MKEWWESRGVCSGCKKPISYRERAHDDPACFSNSIDTSWQARVNPSNARWRPGYRFKTEKYSGYRTYACFYGIDRNGVLVFQGGVRATPLEVARLEKIYAEKRPVEGNWYPGCELDEI